MPGSRWCSRPTLLRPHELRGDWEAALEHYGVARRIWERRGDIAGAAMALNNIGNVYSQQGNWESALANYQIACEIQEPLGATAGLAQALWNMGVLYETLERKPEAIEALTRAVELERRLGRADAEEHAAHLQSLIGTASH